jgi:hypothetical protein
MAVLIASAVSVLVIDCTTTGASPPIMTRRPPARTITWRETRRGEGPAGIGRQLFSIVLPSLLARR